MFVDHAVSEERLPSSNKVGDARWEIGEEKGTRFWRNWKITQFPPFNSQNRSLTFPNLIISTVSVYQ